MRLSGNLRRHGRDGMRLGRVDWCCGIPACAFVGDTPLTDGPGRRLSIVFRTAGCEKARSRGPCFFCGYREQSRMMVDAGGVVSDLQRQFTTGMCSFDFVSETISELGLLSPGSFLCDTEYPPAFRTWVMGEIRRIPTVKRVVIESRHEYVSPSELRRLRCLLRSDQALDLAIGVESSDPWIRNAVLKKDLDWNDLRGVLLACANCDVGSVVYLVVKPPFLTEDAAAQDAVKSAHDVFMLAREIGISLRLAFHPLFISRRTELESLFISGGYRLVGLWRVVEILRRCCHLGIVTVGLNDEGLSDGRVPSSCPACAGLLRAALEKFNVTQDIGIFDGLSCDCQCDATPHEVGFQTTGTGQED